MKPNPHSDLNKLHYYANPSRTQLPARSRPVQELCLLQPIIEARQAVLKEWCTVRNATNYIKSVDATYAAILKPIDDELEAGGIVVGDWARGLCLELSEKAA